MSATTAETAIAIVATMTTCKAATAVTTSSLRILSIDVGTVNMGQCVLALRIHPGIFPDAIKWRDVSIESWERINLVAMTREQMQIRNPNLRDLIDTWRRMMAMGGRLNVDAVLIENQVGTKFKILAHALYTHITSTQPGIPVFCCSANLKLQCSSSGAFSRAEAPPKIKTTWAQRKKMGVLLVKKIIPQINVPEHLLAKWTLCKKKDDMADCMLQGLRILQLL
jgi:hypothetical protein